VREYVKRVLRDEFSQRIKRTLALRVGLLCSNPECQAHTSGPQTDPSNAINVGVAAHITAASSGGPRFDPNMTDKERISAANGIWLCQTCAKLIDSDQQAYPAERLMTWKKGAEEYARRRIGKTKNTVETRTNRRMLAALKREQKLRDDLHRDLIKSPEERRNLPRFCERSRKFAHSEIIMRRLGDTTYPQIDESESISGWGKLEVLDFYHGGIHVILGIEYVLQDTWTRKWAVLTYEQSKLSFPTRFTQGKVFMTGKIPWRNILHYDMRGDEYYPQPHLYVQYADDGAPYEGFAYFLLGNGYEQELSPEHRIELQDLLKLDAN
jgi:hypothetical protein